MATQVGIEEVFRAYLRILKGDRTQESFAKVLKVGRAAVGLILGGDRKVMPEHLERVARAYNLPPSRMLADMAKIALNLELGRPAEEGLGGRVIGPDSLSETGEESTTAHQDRRPSSV